METESTEEGAPPGEGLLHVVNILSNMFGQLMDNDVIFAVVESCDGDLQHSIDALMQITKDSEETLKQPVQEDFTGFNPCLPTIITASNDVQMEPINNSVTADTAEPMVTTTSQSLITTIPMAPPQSVPPLIMNYANASKSTGVIPKKHNLPSNASGQPYSPSEADRWWIDQLTRIIEWHYKGYRTLVLMRGPPGCGKSYLSRKIVDATVGGNEQKYRRHIQSTDDFFIVKGKYVYAKERLSEAHTWNQNRVHKSLRNGLSPVIVDNTNIEIWEMHPYVRFGVREGYYIEIIDPISPWAKNANILFKRNSHNVPLDKVRKMLNNFQGNMSAECLMNYLSVSYPPDKTPPVMRHFPELVQEEIPSITVTQVIGKCKFVDIKTATPQNRFINVEISSGSAKMHIVSKDPLLKCSKNTLESRAPPIPARQDQLLTNTGQGTNLKEQPVLKDNKPASSNCEMLTHNIIKKYNEVEKKLKEFDELDAQWEMGDGWDEPDPTNGKKNELNPSANPFQPKTALLDIMQPSTGNTGPSTEQKSPKRIKEQLMPDTSRGVEWKDLTRFIADWSPDDPSTSRQTLEKLPVEKISSGTSIELGDTDNVLNSRYKVVTGTPRDINFYYIPREEKIPDKRTLDKSSMTHEQMLTMEKYRCKNEEKHFSAFRKMFKNIPRENLRDIFDNCCGDVNWAVEIVIDGVASNAFETVEEDISDTEDFSSEQCECLAAYNIIPSDCRQNQENIRSMATEQTESTPTQKKVKKEKYITETMKVLKKQIEENVVIADNHYSQHCLKIRKLRRGESDQGEASNTPATSEGYGPSTSKEPQNSLVPDYHNSDDESESSQEPEEETITMNVGCEFVNRLDEYFNRHGTYYPSNIVPFINMPISTLNELNALWIESLTNQIESQAAYSDILMKEDEEFARQLAAKEAELEQQGVEPVVPDFKEIMDMDIVLSLYQKGINEWRNNEPNDMAARMSREKLYNLFPDCSPEVLSELLMAHNNNFQTTVEVMLMSTGQSEILEQKNGVNKFVMQKEMERQEKILAEEKKVRKEKENALSEEDWPVLSRTEKVDMKMVDEYRQEAQRHLEQRNINHQKAQVYIQRGMTQCASYASEVAAFHRKKFEQANCRAATSLIQVNAGKMGENQVDLHFLFVAEALIALDIFLDFHIKKLRDNPAMERSKTLFIVTGRGLHSSGGARVKPAVRRRLRERKLKVGEKNPGLLTAVIRAESLLTDEWQPETG